MRQTIAKDSPNRQYVTLSAAFEFFNGRLFDRELPPTIITLHRKAGSYGYYSAKRFEGRADTELETDELALNPGTFAGRSDAQILSTLVHEMVHHWQQHFGKPGRGRYHNEEWAARMETIGLMPTDTGEPVGKRTGQRLTHYIIDGGAFDLACRELLADGVQVQWQSREAAGNGKGKSKANSKQKYSCPVCELNAWAKPNVRLVCGECEVDLVED